MADQSPDRPTQLPIYYERSRHYRTIQVDGVQGGITPRATIQFMFFVETKPTPEYVVHRITSEGVMGEEIERIEKKGIIREAQINVVMDEATTVQFVQLLQKILKQLESFRTEASKGSEVVKGPEVK